MGEVDAGARSRRALTRAAAILVLIGGFAATQQIELKSIDALVVIGVLVALVVTVLAALATFRTKSDAETTTLGLTEAGVFAAGALTIFGIFRTVIPDSTSFQAAPILGLGLVILLLIIWVATDGGGVFGAPRLRGAAAGGGGGGDDGGGTGAPAVTSPLGRLNALQVIVAVAVVLGFAAMLFGLWTSVAVDDKQWSRLIELKGTVEQVAFAALGALLGFAVQGRAVDKAEEKTQEALGVAKDAVATASPGATTTPDDATVERFGGDSTAATTAVNEAKMEVLKQRIRSLERR